MENREKRLAVSSPLNPEPEVMLLGLLKAKSRDGSVFRWRHVDASARIPGDIEEALNELLSLCYTWDD